jgi:hypothetical protein
MRNSYANGGRWDVVGQANETMGQEDEIPKTHLEKYNVDLLKLYDGKYPNSDS